MGDAVDVHVVPFYVDNALRRSFVPYVNTHNAINLTNVSTRVGMCASARVYIL